jgi:hypothetical protein
MWKETDGTEEYASSISTIHLEDEGSIFLLLQNYTVLQWKFTL